MLATTFYNNTIQYSTRSELNRIERNWYWLHYTSIFETCKLNKQQWKRQRFFLAATVCTLLNPSSMLNAMLWLKRWRMPYVLLSINSGCGQMLHLWTPVYGTTCHHNQLLTLSGWLTEVFFFWILCILWSFRKIYMFIFWLLTSTHKWDP